MALLLGVSWGAGAGGAGVTGVAGVAAGVLPRPGLVPLLNVNCWLPSTGLTGEAAGRGLENLEEEGGGRGNESLERALESLVAPRDVIRIPNGVV